MSVTSVQSKNIEAALRAFIADPKPYLIGSEKALDLRGLAAELNALPVYLDFGGCYAIRPDSEIVTFVWDEPYSLKVECDPRIRNLALFQGARKYPELDELVPKRPPEAEDCSHCGGTGVEPVNEKLGFDEDMIVCHCGGLGWLPK